jgi:hypothetical protein
MNSPPAVKIESRMHLLSALAEAAELEHDLLCMYLYSAFSLKTSVEEGLSSEEMSAVNSWRATILKICFEEMTHMALVANLTTAIGGSGHFYRLDFPVRQGYFPSDFVLELAAFDQDSLQHFIFLERPEEEPIKDAEEFTPENNYTRGNPPGRLMAHGGDYSTVGQLYESIENGIVSLSAALGEKKLFCGSASIQISSKDVKIDGLEVVCDEASALTALRLIVTQGEGARAKNDSHFEKFSRIADEFAALRCVNPAFQPSRPVARNPVMRKPANRAGRVWVSEAPAARYLDLANALYSLMLRFLVQVYSMEDRRLAARKILLQSAFSIMHALAAVAALLTRLPAGGDYPGITAGMSFALDRYFTPFELSSEKILLLERLDELIGEINTISAEHGRSEDEDVTGVFANELVSVENLLKKVRDELATISLLPQES